jgi:transcriptional regulator with XRE-family HTH domain
MTNSLSIERPPRGRERPAPPAASKWLIRAETAAVREAINRHIGRRIRAIRVARARTQAQLGEALGLTNQQVQKYEKGANGLTFERLWVMARYFDIDVYYFLDGMWDAAAIAVEPGSAAPVEADPNPRLRLNAARAVHRIKSRRLLSGIVQLLRAEEEEQAGLPDPDEEREQPNDGGAGVE